MIEKIIQSNLGVCPELFYKNPILDKDVARALAKSFVKILHLSQQNSNIHNNLRLSILETIRKMCLVEPKGHLSTDETLTEALSDVYAEQMQVDAADSTDKELDAFFVRRFKNMNINSQHESTVNPEIVQALRNLNENGVYLEIMAKDIVHWDANKGNYLAIIKDLWKTEAVNKCVENMYDDLAIKLKPEIEKIVLDTCHNILVNRDIDLDTVFSDSALIQLVKRSAISPECFQVCTSALNFLFIMTNYDPQMQSFITAFIKKVKLHCPQITFSILYPIHMNHIVVMLDFKINMLPEPLRSHYVAPTLKHMQELRDKSEHDFVMLMSHFPQWFDIYFKSKQNIISPSF